MERKKGRRGKLGSLPLNHPSNRKRNQFSESVGTIISKKSVESEKKEAGQKE
jgi:hypothetical protein